MVKEEMMRSKEEKEMTRGPVVDFELLTKRVGGDMEFLVEIIDIFLGHCPDEMAKLQKLIWAAKRPMMIIGGSRWSPAACDALHQREGIFEG